MPYEMTILLAICLTFCKSSAAPLLTWN